MFWKRKDVVTPKRKPGRKPGKITNCPHTDRKHCARGMCASCYIEYYRKKHPDREKERLMKAKKWKKERYENDPEYREKIKTKRREYGKRHCREHPKWNARKQREYRKRHPEAFNRCMARYYLKHLPKKERIKLYKEVEGNLKPKKL